MLYLQQFPAAVKPKIHKNALHLFSSLPNIIKILNRNLKHFALFLKKKFKKKKEKGMEYLNIDTCI